jgi:hypothetical protein
LRLLIPHSRYDLINRLHQAGAVRIERPGDEGVYIEGLVPARWIDTVRPYVIAAPVEKLRPARAKKKSAVA